MTDAVPCAWECAVVFLVVNTLFTSMSHQQVEVCVCMPLKHAPLRSVEQGKPSTCLYGETETVDSDSLEATPAHE